MIHLLQYISSQKLNIPERATVSVFLILIYNTLHILKIHSIDSWCFDCNQDFQTEYKIPQFKENLWMPLI
jgi:hypothetical protein